MVQPVMPLPVTQASHYGYQFMSQLPSTWWMWKGIHSWHWFGPLLAIAAICGVN